MRLKTEDSGHKTLQLAVVIANDLRVGPLVSEEFVDHQDRVLRTALLGL